MNSGSSVVSVSLSPRHGFSKQPQLAIHLLAGRGVEGDAHCGETVQHLYLKRKMPDAPNLMQVHLLPCELLEDLAGMGFSIGPGELGENVTTRGIELSSLPLGTRLHLGDDAVVELTGLRTPCKKIEAFQADLLKQVVSQSATAGVQARAGVMAIVLQSGSLHCGVAIRTELPPLPHRPMQMI